MRKRHRLKYKLQFFVIVFISLGIYGCSTTSFKSHPVILSSEFENSDTVPGIRVAAKPLLHEEELEDYFGVNLLKKGILALYIVIKNDTPQDSFIFQADSIRIETPHQNGMDNNPAKDTQKTGEAIAWSGAILLSPPLVLIALHQLSNASIIEENFESKKLRTKTLDPGQQTSGFAYVNFDEANFLSKVNLCFKIYAPLSEETFPISITIDLQE